MNLLIISNNPSSASFRQRIEIHLDLLSKNGVESQVYKLPPHYLARWKLYKNAEEFDAVFLHRKCLNFFDALILRKYSKKIIYDFDDAMMYSSTKPASDRTSHFKLFRRTAKLVDMIIVGNTYLAQQAKEFNTNVHILPTGLDTNVYQLTPKSRSDGKIRLVWIGSKSTLRYLLEIKPALEEIGLRFPNVLLRIICDDFFELQNMVVEKCPWSLDSQVIDLLTGDIGLAPLPDDRFTRGKCGFKILQYQAASLPVVASPIGVNSEYVCDGVTGYHAWDIEQWIAKISELIENAELRKQMGDAGRIHVQPFDCDVIGQELARLILNS